MTDKEKISEMFAKTAMWLKELPSGDLEICYPSDGHSTAIFEFNKDGSLDNVSIAWITK